MQGTKQDPETQKLTLEQAVIQLRNGAQVYIKMYISILDITKIVPNEII